MYKGSDGVTKKYIAESWSQVTPGLPIPTAFRPFIELMANKNLYSGAPILGAYELQRLDELQARGTTRDIAKKLSEYTGNLSSFLKRKKEGSVKDPIMSPIVVDYLLGAYLTGMLQYPIDILNTVNPFNILGRDELSGDPIAKREDQADYSSFKNAFSVVTRRFKMAGPIKNSQYHKDWRELIDRAKKLKQIDFTQMDLKESHSSKLIGLFTRVKKQLDSGNQFGLEEEVLAFSNISPIIKQGQQLLIESQRDRNNIMSGPLDGESKKELIDILLEKENMQLKILIDTLSDMEIEFIFDKTFALNESFPVNLLFGTAENAVKSNPRENKK